MPQGSQLGLLDLIIIGVVAGAVPWIIRSLFDVVYVERRRRQTVALAIAADLSAMIATSHALRQREFLEAVALRKLPEIGELKKLALIRNPAISDPVQRFVPDVFLLKRVDTFAIFSLYRQIFSLRLIFERLDELVRSDVSSAFALGEQALILYDCAEKEADSLSATLGMRYRSVLSI